MKYKHGQMTEIYHDVVIKSLGSWLETCFLGLQNPSFFKKLFRVKLSPDKGLKIFQLALKLIQLSSRAFLSWEITEIGQNYRIPGNKCN